VLAVLGLALSIAYATANRSLMNARQAQEYAEASALVQSQIEQLRANSAVSDNSSSKYIYRPSTATFCVNTAGSVVEYPVGNPHDDCKQGKGELYTLQIKRNSTTNTFTVTATWGDVTGHGTNTLTMSYRLYQP